MKIRKAMGWALLMCLESALAAAKEPKDFVAENLHKAHDVIEAGFFGCQLQMQISYSGTAVEAFRVVIQLEKMNPATIQVDENLGINLAAKEGATPVTIYAGAAHSESRFRLYVGDRALAESLAENLAQVTAICNLYDCPDGKFCKDRIDETRARAAAAPRREATPDLSREEIDRALAHDVELATELLLKIRLLEGDQEEIKAVLRTLHRLGPADLDVVREKYYLPRPLLMPSEQRVFYEALLGARFGNSKPVQAYLDAGGEIERQATNRESLSLEDDTLLIASVVGNHMEIVQLLLARGADANRAGRWGRRPVDIAADDRRTSILEFLLRKGASTGRNSQGGTPLWDAAASNDSEAIKLLLRHDADPNERGTYDEPPLYRAALNGHMDAARLLLAGEAEVNGTNKEGQTPLMAAIIDGSVPTMELLLAHGARIDHKDNKGQTALELAREMRRHEVTNWLVAHGAVTEEDRLRKAWAAARPTSAPSPMLPARARSCREGASASDLAGVWEDPEYQDFVRRLRDLSPPLGAEEATRSTSDLLESATSSLLEALPLLLSSIQEKQPESSDEVDGGIFLGAAGTRLLSLASYLLTHEDRVANMTGNQLLDATTNLQIGLIDLYGKGFLTLPHDTLREAYDLLHTASDLVGTLVPCDSLTLEDQMLAGVLASWLKILPAPVGLTRASAPSGDRDIERLQQQLGPWLEKREAPAFALLEGGLLGHTPLGRAAELSTKVGDRLPRLVLFYRPDSWRGKSFDCKPVEKQLVADLISPDASCAPESVEFALLLSLLDEASETGEIVEKKQRYEVQFLSLFLLEHHRDGLARIRPSVEPQLLEWASGFLHSVDLIGSSQESLSPPLELAMQEAALKRIHNPARAWELYEALREALSY